MAQWKSAVMFVCNEKLYESRHEISNDVVTMCDQQRLRPGCTYVQTDQSFC